MQVCKSLALSRFFTSNPGPGPDSDGGENLPVPILQKWIFLLLLPIHCSVYSLGVGQSSSMKQLEPENSIRVGSGQVGQAKLLQLTLHSQTVHSSDVHHSRGVVVPGFGPFHG